MRFFSPSKIAFYDDAIHGTRKIAQPLTDAQVKAGRKPKMIANPDCKLPADAIEIDDALWEELMAAQATGKQIAVRAGRPVAIDAVRSAEDIIAANMTRRDRLLAASDWTQLADTLLDVPEYKAAMAAWRQALRDMDLAAGIFPDEPQR
jgi:hypothetical protein